MSSPTRARRCDSGFTLLELLVVIALLAVLGGIAVLGVGALTDEAESVSCDADARAIDTAEQALVTLSGSYGTEEDLVAAGYLDGASEYHDIVLVADRYELVGTGACEDLGLPVAAEAPSDCTEGRVDVNSAGIEDLDLIRHIGPARAQQIIDLRPFEDLADLARVSGISAVRAAEIEAEGIACV